MHRPGAAGTMEIGGPAGQWHGVGRLWQGRGSSPPYGLPFRREAATRLPPRRFLPRRQAEHAAEAA